MTALVYMISPNCLDVTWNALTFRAPLPNAQLAALAKIPA